jgi:hypothetical protein
MAQKLSHLVRQREVLRQQSILIAEALARTDDEIELLRAQARATGVVLEQDADFFPARTVTRPPPFASNRVA